MGDNQQDSLIDEIKDLRGKVEGLSDMVNSLSNELNTLRRTTGLNKDADNNSDENVASVIQSDEFVQFKQEQKIRKSKDYEIAAQQFIYLNEQVSRAFKKNDKLRYLYFDMISNGNISMNALRLTLESLKFNEEDIDIYLNLADEIRRFREKQSDILLQFNRGIHDKEYTLFEELLIYPREGDAYNEELHDNIFDDHGIEINKICQLGCKFEGFFIKAIVKLR